MPAPHHHDEWIVEQGRRGETLTRAVRAADRHIEIAAVEAVDSVQGSTWTQIEANRRRRGRDGSDQRWSEHHRGIVVDREREASVGSRRVERRWLQGTLHLARCARAVQAARLAASGPCPRAVERTTRP